MLSVSGRVRALRGEALHPLTVIAYLSGLPSTAPFSRDPLGRTQTDASGSFGIEYELPRTAGANDGGVGLVFRVLRGGREVPIVELKAGDEPVHAVPAAADGAIELVVDVEAGGQSEWETLTAAMAGPLDGFPLDRLTPDDVEYVRAEARLDESRVALAVKAVRAADALGAPAEGLYGLARMGFALDVQPLEAAGEAALQDALVSAIDEGVISESFQARVDGTARVLARGGRPSVRVVLRLVGPSGAPLGHEPVRAVDLDADSSEGDLGAGVTDARGEVAFLYHAIEDALPHGLSVELTRTAGRRVTVAPDPAALFTAVVFSDSPAWDAAGIELSDPLAQALAIEGLGTLPAIRRRGPIGDRADLRDVGERRLRLPISTRMRFLAPFGRRWRARRRDCQRLPRRRRDLGHGAEPIRLGGRRPGRRFRGRSPACGGGCVATLP